MKSITKILAGLALMSLVGACTVQKPEPAKIVGNSRIATIEPQAKDSRNLYYVPPPPVPGERTVNDVLEAYGPYARLKLAPYFAKAEVSYPPKEVVLVALKQEKKLELWARNKAEFRFIRDYDIQAASGVAGPKLRQGDKQVPEGIYRIEAFNPNSNFHLSMKINYPNEFDFFHAWREGRVNPGSDIFIHGKDISSGCLAMGDEAIEELFVLTAQAGIENVKVLIAPYDPRIFPLKAISGDLPEWTVELYSNISGEIKALSKAVESAKTGL